MEKYSAEEYKQRLLR